VATKLATSSGKNTSTTRMAAPRSRNSRAMGEWYDADTFDASQNERARCEWRRAVRPIGTGDAAASRGTQVPLPQCLAEQHRVRVRGGEVLRAGAGHA
jgi:hypothetical protein